MLIDWRIATIVAKKQDTTRLNGQITAREIRLIGPEGEKIGIVSLNEALNQAEEASLDLVEISPQSKPPVCRIMDYGKYKFEQQKKAHAAKKKQKQITVKEVKLRPGTDEGDYQVKLRNLIRFIEHGDKAKVTIRFRGREMAHQQLGMEMMKRIEEDMGELVTIEQRPRLEGRQMVMMMAPAKKKK